MPQRSDNHAEFVSGSEFTRWMGEQSEFRARLEARLTNQHLELVNTLGRILGEVKETNGRVRQAEAAIAGFKERLASIEADDAKIERVVETIRDEGCSQYAAHAAVLETGPMRDWAPKKKIAAAGGFVAIGMLIWPAVQEIAGLLHALVDRLP